MPEAVRQTVVRHMTHQAPEITFSNGNHAKFSCQHGHDPQGLLFQEKTRTPRRPTDGRPPGTARVEPVSRASSGCTPVSGVTWRSLSVRRAAARRPAGFDPARVAAVPL